MAMLRTFQRQLGIVMILSIGILMLLYSLLLLVWMLVTMELILSLHSLIIYRVNLVEIRLSHTTVFHSLLVSHGQIFQL